MRKILKLIITLIIIPFILTGCTISIQWNDKKNDDVEVGTNDSKDDSKDDSEEKNNKEENNKEENKKPNETGNKTPSQDENKKPDKNENTHNQSKPSEEKKVIEYRAYYYNAIDDIKVYKSTEKETMSNEEVYAYIKKSLQTTIKDGFIAPIKETIKINSLKHDSNKKIAYIDIEGKYVEKMDVGGGVESELLQCIVNTLGYNLKCDKVIITLDGKPYASGHMNLKENEAMNVNYNGYNKVK